MQRDALAAWISILAMATPALAGAAPSPRRIYSSISLTTDYRYNGVSYSDGPAWQASVHWLAPRKFYLGVWSSAVDFDDPGSTSFELDFYLGREFVLADSLVSAEILYTTFPDKSFAGPTYDFLQLKTRLRRQLGSLTLGMHAAWTPAASYGSGEASRVGVEGSYVLTRSLTASAAAGRRWVELGQDRTYWDAGLIASWKRWSLDLRYVDTNLDFAACGNSARCDATIVATLTYRFW